MEFLDCAPQWLHILCPLQQGMSPPPHLLPLSSLWACTIFVIKEQLLWVDLDP